MLFEGNKFYLPLDLQLFAEKSVTVDGMTFSVDDNDDDRTSPFEEDADDILDEITVGDDDDFARDDYGEFGDSGASDDDSKGDDDGDDSEGLEGESDVENDNGDEEKETDNSKKENPIAKAVIAERKRLQAQMDAYKKEAEIAKKLMKLVGVDDIELLQQRLEQAEAARIAQERGITPEQAQLELKRQRELEEQRREIRRLKYAQEVAELKRDPFFSDIEDYREEFEEIAERTGQTIEEVYMAKRGRQRMKEFEREVEQRTLANKQKRQKSKVDTTSNGEQIKKETYNLTPEQLAVAQAAVKMGTFESVAEYAKFLKKK